jgi:hypothetical protein
MSEDTVSPAPTPRQDAADATRPVRKSPLARLDDALRALARHLAELVHRRVGSIANTIALFFIGAFLLLLTPRAVLMLAVPFHWIDCYFPVLGKWWGLSCAQAPQGTGWWNVAYLLGWFALYLMLTVVIWFLAHLFVAFSSTIVRSELVRAHDDIARSALITGLAPADPNKAVAEAKAWADRADLYAGPADKWKEELQKSGLDPEKRADAGGWQQAARMVFVHRARLRKIFVLPSSETKHLVGEFKRYLDTLFGKSFDVEVVTGPDKDLFADQGKSNEQESRSYDNYDYLRDGLRRAVETARDRVPHLADRDICIDATPGFKLFSIAAAVVALDRNVWLGYVVSAGGHPDEGVVKLFDPRIEFVAAARDRISQRLSQGG